MCLLDMLKENTHTKKNITDGEKITAAMLLSAPHSMCNLCSIDNIVL